MKALFATLLLTTSVARADYLDCSNKKAEPTLVSFFNNWGKITFQLGGPYKGEYLYVLGQCYSQNTVGLPYNCETATSNADIIDVNLLRGTSGEPVAEVITHYDDRPSTTELIPCNHIVL